MNISDIPTDETYDVKEGGCGEVDEKDDDYG
jgi:hypothetical protein